MKKNILVTGVTGFVGSKLKSSLEKQGYTVYGHSSAMSDVSGDEPFTTFLDKKIDHVFHCAANTFVPLSWEKPAAFIRTNVLGTSNMLEFCRMTKASYTYVSAYVYGSKVKNPISEDALPDPNNPYALSKKLGEEVCEFYSRNFQVPGCVIRPFNIYGPGQPSGFLIPFIIGQIKKGTEVKVKDLLPKRDYIFIDDLIECLIKSMEVQKFSIMNAGTGKSYSVQQVIDTLFEISGKVLPVHSDNQVRYNEISDTVASIALSEKLIGWKPSVSLKEGLTLTYNQEK